MLSSKALQGHQVRSESRQPKFFLHQIESGAIKKFAMLQYRLYLLKQVDTFNSLQFQDLTLIKKAPEKTRFFFQFDLLSEFLLAIFVWVIIIQFCEKTITQTLLPRQHIKLFNDKTKTQQLMTRNLLINANNSSFQANHEIKNFIRGPKKSEK